MKLQYLGTAAAEGCPAIFCNCDNCKKARELGGKNVRTRSQTIINDELLIDFPSDTYMHALNNKLDLSAVKYLLITHSHPDHFSLSDLYFRGDCYGHNMKEENLTVVGNERIVELTSAYLEQIKEPVKEGIKVQLAKAFETFKLGDYEITPLPAKHLPSENALIYIIKHSGKTILYAHDTGLFFESVFEYLEKNKIYFDFVSMDCTNTRLEFNLEKCGHMGYNHLEVVNKRLKEMGAIDKNTIMYVNHFSHNGDILQADIEKNVAYLGYKVSYDGCIVEI